MKKEKLRTSWLVQRFTKPFKSVNENSPLAKLQSAFQFGGGLPRGGLTKEAYQAIEQHVRFDYMGSAEFEFGAIPKSLQRMADSVEDISCWETKVDDVTFYVIGWSHLKEDINQRIDDLAHCKIKLKKTTMLQRIMEGEADENDRLPIGWFDIDNDFMFFSSKESFDGMRGLFGK